LVISQDCVGNPTHYGVEYVLQSSPGKACGVPMSRVEPVLTDAFAANVSVLDEQFGDDASRS
jgi:hypothetical protein